MKKTVYLIAILVLTIVGYAIANFAGYSPLVLLAGVILTPIDALALAVYFSH